MKDQQAVIREITFTIGRASNQNFRLNHESISSEHIRITYENSRYYVTDYRSTNGTRLRGVEIKGKGPHELKSGDRIGLGNTLIIEFLIE